MLHTPCQATWAHLSPGFSHDTPNEQESFWALWRLQPAVLNAQRRCTWLIVLAQTRSSVLPLLYRGSCWCWTSSVLFFIRDSFDHIADVNLFACKERVKFSVFLLEPSLTFFHFKARKSKRAQWHSVLLLNFRLIIPSPFLADWNSLAIKEPLTNAQS